MHYEHICPCSLKDSIMKITFWKILKNMEMTFNMQKWNAKHLYPCTIYIQAVFFIMTFSITLFHPLIPDRK